MENSELPLGSVDAWHQLDARWAAVLGFAFGGFFDGIVLHQILQWHHLLSLAQQGLSLRTLILWDGYFHALMYVLAIIALVGLYRSKQSSREIIPYVVLGFGIWHIVDALLSHWILGLHRVRDDSANPLFWDILWLVVFGIIPLIWAWIRVRRQKKSQDFKPNRKLWSILALMTLGGSVWAMQPPSGNNYTAIVFAPHVSVAGRWNAVAQMRARVAWTAPDMNVFLVNMEEGQNALNFYLHGAILVNGGRLPSGCITWTKS